ncbi:permease-like cell division protein FtsX [Porticoccaceae bacterium]|nr:permease-like cell division protein FtsX [Porticoccaceae bacterium]
MAATNSKSRDSAQRGARGQVLSRLDRWRSYRQHHRSTLTSSATKILREPLQSLLTILVIAIALTLPAALYLGVENIRQLSGGVDASAQISVFVKKGARESALEALGEKLEGLSGVASVRYISAQAAVDEFEALSGFGSALQYLDENPLPDSFLVQPLLVSSAERLVTDIRQLNLVDDVQLDLEWLQRLDALLDMGRKLVLALGAALGLGVILVVGNTIRLAIQSRRDEITVVKLVGGTDAYVRRPFLYSGFLFGIFGALVAAILLTALGFWLAGPVDKLALLYRSQFSITGLGLGGVATLLLIGGTVGLIGAWLAVGQHLRKIKPR